LGADANGNPDPAIHLIRTQNVVERSITELPASKGLMKMTARVALFPLREQRASVAIFLMVITIWTLSGCRPATAPVKISQAEAENLLVRSGTMVLPQGFNKMGFVDAELHVDTEGNVKDVEANSSDPTLTDIAVTAFKKYKFRPYLVNGRPVECLISGTANFPRLLPVNVSLRPLKYRLSQSY